MKSFALATIATLAAAQGFGTTGHYGNAYAGVGKKDHANGDHMYGYDSVKSRKDLKISGAPRTLNQTRLGEILTRVREANTARITQLDLVFNRKKQRLQEIHDKNLRQIKEPFEYQDRLLDKELDDVIVAMTEATNDASDAFNDMLERLERLYDDKVALLKNEETLVQNAITRSIVDRKDLCAVVGALRVDFLKNVECNLAAAGAPTYNTADAAAEGQWKVYEGLFDDFHYDIGHGKGQGTGSVDMAPVTDGFGQGSSGFGFSGDSQTTVGAPTRTFETPRNAF